MALLVFRSRRILWNHPEYELGDLGKALSSVVFGQNPNNQKPINPNIFLNENILNAIIVPMIESSVIIVSPLINY